MRIATLFFICLGVTMGCLLGGLHAKYPLHNFGAIIVLWLVYYFVTNGPRERSRARYRRAILHEQCMRAYLRNNRF